MSQQCTPLLTLTRTLSGTVAANRFVTPAGAQAGADAVALGVSRQGGVSGDLNSIDELGTTIVEAGAAISDGDTHKTKTNKRTNTKTTTGAKLGIALQAAGASGQFI